MILREVTQQVFVNQCRFQPRNILLLGHGLGGSAALAAVAAWYEIEFAGVVSIGGRMSEAHYPPAGHKVKTPALVLSGTSDIVDDEALKCICESFGFVNYDLEVGATVACPERKEVVDLLVPYFSYRWGQVEWMKQAVISFGR